jgi:hypothetical protein
MTYGTARLPASNGHRPQNPSTAATAAERLPMIANRRDWRGGVVVVLMIELIFGSITAPRAQDQLTDIKPLVGKWQGFSARNNPADMTIKEDGSYELVVHGNPARGGGIRRNTTFSGTMQFADGKAFFKHSDGSTGTVTLNGDDNGKRIMKWVRDDGAGTAEYEPAK